MNQSTFWDVLLKAGRPRNGSRVMPNDIWRKEIKHRYARFRPEECPARRIGTVEESLVAYVHQLDACVKKDTQGQAASHMLAFMTKIPVFSPNLFFVSYQALISLTAMDMSHIAPCVLVSKIVIPNSLLMAALILVTGFLLSLLRIIQLKSLEARYQKVPNIGSDGADVPVTSLNGSAASYHQNPPQFNYAVPEEKINTYCVIDSRLVDS